MMKTIFKKYSIKKELGRGGMGIVYLAIDTVLERPVAIKTISSASDDPLLKKRFLREAKATGKLRHNNIVTIYDFGIEEDQLYIVMEYLEGEDLSTIITQKKPIDIKDKLEIIRQVCIGLNYAHEKEIIHRDVKPANVRLLNDGSIKIVDFGLALMQSSHLSDLSMSNALMGTPNYTAPERLKGGDASGKADQFAVGLILYELLTYHRAFQGDTFTVIAYQILSSEPKDLEPEITALYPELGNIIKKSISKDPDQRFFSLNEMAAALETLQTKMKQDQYSLTSAVGVSDQVITQELQVKKKRKMPVATFSVTIIFLIILVFLFIGVFKKAPTAPGPGFLSFDVKPYAAVEAVINIKTNQTIEIKTESIITPVRLKLKAGEYRIIYSHPEWGGEKRSMRFTINPGETKHVQDVVDQSFVKEAVKYYSIPLKPEEMVKDTSH